MTYWLYIFDAAILAALSFAILQLSLIGRCVVATQEDVNKLTAQVVKVGQEVTQAHASLVTELDGVKAQLAAAGVAEQVDLTGLAAAIQVVDDLNPDQVVEVPEPVVEVPEPVVEVPEPVVEVPEPVVEEPVVEEPVVEEPVVEEPVVEPVVEDVVSDVVTEEPVVDPVVADGDSPVE